MCQCIIVTQILKYQPCPALNGIFLHAWSHWILHLCFKYKKIINYRSCINSAHFRHIGYCATRDWDRQQNCCHCCSCFLPILDLLPLLLLKHSSSNAEVQTAKLMHCWHSRKEPHWQHNRIGWWCTTTNISGVDLLFCAVCLYFWRSCPRETLSQTVKRLFTRSDLSKGFLFSFSSRFLLEL